MSRAKILTILIVAVVFVAFDLGLGSSYDYIVRTATKAVQPEKVIVTEPNDVFLYGYKRNFSAQIVDGRLNYPFRSNSLGFRDVRVRDVAKQPAGGRVVFIGDSFTEGFGVDYEKTFVHLIDTATPGREVLNAAVDSYSPAVYLAKIMDLVEKQGLRFDELVLFLDLSDMVDNLERRVDAAGKVIVDNSQPRFANWQNRQPEELAKTGAAADASAPNVWRDMRHFLRTHSLSVRFVYKVREKLAAMGDGCGLLDGACSREKKQQESTASDLRTYFAAHTGMWIAGMWTVDEALFKKVGEPGLAHSARQLDRLWEFLAGRGMRMTLAVYPWPHQLLEGDSDSVQVRYWRDWAGRNGVRFVNLFPPFFERPAAETIKKYFLTGDVHWNEFGHAVVAKAFLAQWLADDRKATRD